MSVTRNRRPANPVALTGVPRDAAGPPTSPALRVGPLQIAPGEGLATLDGNVLSLSVREFGLLVALAQRRGRIVARTELYETVWGAPLRDSDRSVDVYVSKLRVKLDHALRGTRFIHTHFGFGYRLDPEPDPGPAAEPDPSQPFHNRAARR